MRIEENKPLAPFTTLGVGGAARWFVEATSEEDVAQAAGWARENKLPLFVLGGGSNLVVADEGFGGLVLHVVLEGVNKQNEGNCAVYQAAAGENWEPFVERTVSDNCAGLECLAGIPGTVGGTPVQNVGAYGQEVASSIAKVRAFDLEERRFLEFAREECGFAYRHSRFNTVDRGRYVVTRVDYRLTPDGRPTLRYAELERAFAGQAKPRLGEVAEAVRRIRRTKGMLLVEGDPDCRSAGSFFKNPMVSREQVRAVANAAGKEPPAFPVDGSDDVKIPAAWLIEQAGFVRGAVRGGAGISSKHTLALVNRGGATAAEILTLARAIASAVECRFGIRLEMEPVLVGFEGQDFASRSRMR